MTSFAALSPHHDHHATFQVTDRDDPLFKVFETVIDYIQRLAVENCCGILERKAAFLVRPVTFG